jgi:hypothetical protein
MIGISTWFGQDPLGSEATELSSHRVAYGYRSGDGVRILNLIFCTTSPLAFPQVRVNIILLSPCACCKYASAEPRGFQVKESTATRHKTACAQLITPPCRSSFQSSIARSRHPFFGHSPALLCHLQPRVSRMGMASVSYLANGIWASALGANGFAFIVPRANYPGHHASSSIPQHQNAQAGVLRGF